MRYLFIIPLFFSVLASAQQPVFILKSKLQKASDADKIALYKEISEAYTAAYPDSAVNYCNQGIRLAQKLNDKRSQAILLLQLGKIHLYHHHPDLARRFDNDALSIFQNISDKKSIASVYQELGLVDAEQKDFISATRSLEKAINFYQLTHDSAAVAVTYEKFGNINEQKGDIEKALSYNLKALALYERLHSKSDNYFDLLKHIGELYLKKGDKQSALSYLKKGISNSNSNNLRHEQIDLLDEEGKILEQTGDKVKALDEYKQSLKEAQQYHQPEKAANALMGIASVLEKKNAKGSLKDLKEALSIARKLHAPELEAKIYAAMSSVYRQDKDYKEALLALVENHHLMDSLIGVDTSREIQALDSSYQLEASREQIGQLKHSNDQEKKEIKIGIVILIAVFVILILLWIYVRKVSKLNGELEASNRIKDTLFSVIGHDLKGPAGSAIQLFELMETEDFNEQEFRGMISEVRKQTTASFELLNALFNWGRAQMQGVKVNQEDFDPAPIISRNISLLKAQAAIKRIQIQNHAKNTFIIHADRDHFDFVIRNLLSNAIKFSYDPGNIDLDMFPAKNGKEVVFSVKDSGTGISPSKQKEFLKSNMQVAFGTKGEKGSGLGLLLTKDFLKANQGRIWMESKEGYGTTFYFSLPMVKVEN